MKLATIRTPAGSRAVRLESGTAVETGDADVGELLAHPEWRAHAASAAGGQHLLADLDFAPLILRPEKIICVGLNYRTHILEMGRELPQHPTLFAKHPPALIGACDDILLPTASDCMDWEAELAVIVGAEVRHATPDQAAATVAGYSVLNDITARDWQYRTLQWLQGKTFEATTPLGPALVTTDDPNANEAGQEIACELDGAEVQRSTTADLVFGPADLVSYISTIVTLRPGDVIATGTPGGVGHARDPQQYLTDGAVLTTRVAGIGECRNTCRVEKQRPRP